MEVECQICKKKMHRITNTHLWYAHQLSRDIYLEQFPGAKLESEEYIASLVKKKKGHTYEEIFGEDQGRTLRQVRQDGATEQMKDPKQIDLRKAKCGKHERKLLMPFELCLSDDQRKEALDKLGAQCTRCGETNRKKLAVHHKKSPIDHRIENLDILCRGCHRKKHAELRKVESFWKGSPDIERGMFLILRGLSKDFGLPLDDVNLRDTPQRVARMYSEIFEGLINTEQQLEDICLSVFPEKYQEIVLVKDIQVFSMCIHHFLPVDLRCSLAYIPRGKVLGISKLVRLVEVLAKRPLLQEGFARDVVDFLMKLLNPQGVAFVATGVHYCMRMRGVRQQSSEVVTSAMRGIFMEDAQARNEFLRLIGK